jgi:hypothetical protein
MEVTGILLNTLLSASFGGFGGWIISVLYKEKVSIEMVMRITGMSKKDTNIFLDWCRFSPEFISNLTEYDLISVIVYKFKQYQNIYLNQRD